MSNARHFDALGLLNCTKFIIIFQKYPDDFRSITLKACKVNKLILKDGAARLQNALEMNMRKMKEQHQKDISILKSSHEETINELKLKLQKEADQEIKAGNLNLIMSLVCACFESVQCFSLILTYFHVVSCS